MPTPGARRTAVGRVARAVAAHEPGASRCSPGCTPTDTPGSTTWRRCWARRRRPFGATKRAVALAAAELVAPNMVVALSGGTTLTLLARMLRGRSVNVVTNAVNVAAELYGARATKVIVTGGALKLSGYELVGAAAEPLIRAYHVDLLFCSCSGVDEAGFGRRDHAEAAVVKAFRRVAARTVMLIDRGKLGRPYRARVASFDEVDRVLVDGPLDPAWRARLAAGGAEVVEVSPCQTGAP